MNILRYYHANHKNLLASSIENCPVGLRRSRIVWCPTPYLRLTRTQSFADNQFFLTIQHGGCSIVCIFATDDFIPVLTTQGNVCRRKRRWCRKGIYSIGVSVIFKYIFDDNDNFGTNAWTNFADHVIHRKYNTYRSNITLAY